jgi:ankyrin repeat protein
VFIFAAHPACNTLRNGTNVPELLRFVKFEAIASFKMFLETYTGDINVLDEVHTCTLFLFLLFLNVTFIRQDGVSALHYAISKTSESNSDALEMCRALIARNADVTKTHLVHLSRAHAALFRIYFSTSLPLYFLSSSRLVLCARTCIAQNGYTPLEAAIVAEATDIVQLLLNIKVENSPKFDLNKLVNLPYF